MLPFEPETIDELRARFPAALETVFTYEFLERFPEEQAGLHRKHVFDFQENKRSYRLVVSVEAASQIIAGLARVEIGTPVLHVSASSLDGDVSAATLAHLTGLIAGANVYLPGRTVILRLEGINHLVLPLPAPAPAGGAA